MGSKGGSIEDMGYCMWVLAGDETWILGGGLFAFPRARYLRGILHIAWCIIFYKTQLVSV